MKRLKEALGYRPVMVFYALAVCMSLGTPRPVFAQAAPDAPDVDVWSVLGAPLTPEAPLTDKSGYSILKPTPDGEMRAFSTDRPGKTHSSTTVDAGHFQLESDFINVTTDHNATQQTLDAYAVATPIFKLGVTNWADLEVATAFYGHSRVTDRSSRAVTDGGGFGDMSFGSKINLFGNDGGAQSLAILPFIKAPTAAHNLGNGVTEYTVNIPYTINLDTLWSVTSEPAFGLLKNINNDGLHGDYSFLVNLNRPIFVKTLTAAIEFAGEYASDRNVTPRYTLDPSLQWLIMPEVQLDIGVYIGLNRAAPDYNGYTGISFRY